MLAGYSPNSAANYQRVLRKLKAVGCMSKEECERAAFVIIEKEQCLKAGIVYDDD